MEFIRGEHNIAARHHGCVASVGNYDGLHPGHRKVIKSLVDRGRDLDLPVTIVSFEPHPLEFFVPDAAPPKLMTVREKIEALKELNVDHFCCLRFNHRLANTEPENFVEDLLIAKLGVRYVVVGDDFRFGRNRRGNFEMLRSICRRYDAEVSKMETIEFDGERISSSRIRDCLAAGNIGLANRILGRDFSMSGRIVRGNGNARNWGFATANIKIEVTKPAVSGIFVVEVDLPDKNSLPGVASLGFRPTIGGDTQLLEVHLLDFDRNIYGQRIRVRFQKKLRDEIKFPSIDKMCEQIQQDIATTRIYFSQASQINAR